MTLKNLIFHTSRSHLPNELFQGFFSTRARYSLADPFISVRFSSVVEEKRDAEH